MFGFVSRKILYLTVFFSEVNLQICLSLVSAPTLSSMSGMPYLPQFMWSPLPCKGESQDSSDLENSLGRYDQKYETKLERIIEKQRIEIERLKKKVRDTTTSLQHSMGLNDKHGSWPLRVKFSGISRLRYDKRATIRSKEYRIGEVVWRILLRREKVGSTPFVTVHLEAKCEERSEWSFSILDSYSLISFKNLDECHEVESEDITQYDERENSYGIDLIEMEELFTDSRCFVRDDSILLEIDVRVFDNA